MRPLRGAPGLSGGTDGCSRDICGTEQRPRGLDVSGNYGQQGLPFGSHSLRGRWSPSLGTKWVCEVTVGVTRGHCGYDLKPGSRRGSGRASESGWPLWTIKAAKLKGQRPGSRTSRAHWTRMQASVAGRRGPRSGWGRRRTLLRAGTSLAHDPVGAGCQWRPMSLASAVCEPDPTPWLPTQGLLILHLLDGPPAQGCWQTQGHIQGTEQEGSKAAPKASL
jgi:hypothetical protein